jgi:putative PIN family toxin of toxin-antitoxin system
MDDSKVVLDTNVWVAAGFNRRSASAKIVEAVRQGQLRMVWDDATRREVDRMMRRIPPLRGYAIGELFRASDRFSAATHRERFADIPDPDDRKFAALAHAAHAILVSSDEHLLGYRGGLELTVLTPAAFWRRAARDEVRS